MPEEHSSTIPLQLIFDRMSGPVVAMSNEHCPCINVMADNVVHDLPGL